MSSNHTMKRRVTAVALATAVAMLAPSSAGADAVTDWNIRTGTVITAAGGGPLQARVNAMVQIAVHDALNAIDPRYASHNHIGRFNPNASPEAAVARATRDVLLGTLPASQHATVDAMYASYIAGLSCAPAQPQCLGDGAAAGAAAAAAMLQERHLDGAENPHRPYTLAPGPGVYQPTPQAANVVPNVQLAGWADVKTFALGKSSQFVHSAQFAPGRAAMLDVTSAEYAADYNEVKNVGSAAVRNADPGSEASRIARFWPNGGRDYNAIVRTLVAPLPDQTLWDNARLFALVNMATSDASVATFSVKYQYNFWRPYTAIRWADDGNPATEPDPTWTPYLPTPPYPDYTCGVPTLVGASTGMLREYFGTDALPFSHTAREALTNVDATRQFQSLSQASAEAASARVYAGIHFRTGCVRAVEQAEDIASFIFRTQLRPLGR